MLKGMISIDSFRVNTHIVYIYIFTYDIFYIKL